MMMPKQKPEKPAPPMAPSCDAVKPNSAPPVVENAAANREADAGGENGHEAGPKKPTGVVCDAFSFCGHGTVHRCWVCEESNEACCETATIGGVAGTCRRHR